jgi:SAM-dependent methyltransferase
MERLRPWLSEQAQGESGVGADIACGTGLSSLALADLVNRVWAFDLSPSMLTEAAEHPRIRYAQAPAEELPLSANSVDVITVAQGIHWFDRPTFFAQARRILRRGGVLCVYDMFFLGQLAGEPLFNLWVKQRYNARYPAPARWPYTLDEAQAKAEGFSFWEEEFRHDLPMNRAQLVSYLLTHSNTIAASDEGREFPYQTAQWLDEELQQFLPDQKEGLVGFRGVIRVLKPQNQPK